MATLKYMRLYAESESEREFSDAKTAALVAIDFVDSNYAMPVSIEDGGVTVWRRGLEMWDGNSDALYQLAGLEDE